MSTLGEVRAVTSGSRGVLGMWWRGSLVMAGYACRCVGQGFALAWRTARTDAAAVAQAKDKVRARREAAAKKAEKAGKESTLPGPDAPIELDPEVGKRSFLAALGSVVLGGGLAVVAVGTGVSALVPLIPDLTPWRPLIFGGGFVIWSAGALMLAPPPTPKDDHESDSEGEELGEDGQEHTGEDQEQTPAPDPGTALLLHVVGALAAAEAAGRTGVHLDVVIDSAEDAGLIPGDTDQGVFRDWLTAAGIPTVDKLGMRIGGKPVTRVGLRVDGATAALGMSPAALLRARSQAPATAPGETPAAASRMPAQAVGEGPAEAAANTPAEAPVLAPASTPAPAALRLIPGGLLGPDSTPSPALSQGQAQEAR
ncbi:hypothetical protein ACIA98_41150 [Streptomyces sp. NPDC051366]|uniref:hypothetical protein n=1 Tax=Streptomyces sp. NPDC051366 TaxID=3365652 RepID=UPI0037A55953